MGPTAMGHAIKGMESEVPKSIEPEETSPLFTPEALRHTSEGELRDAIIRLQMRLVTHGSTGSHTPVQPSKRKRVVTKDSDDSDESKYKVEEGSNGSNGSEESEESSEEGSGGDSSNEDEDDQWSEGDGSEEVGSEDQDEGAGDAEIAEDENIITTHVRRSICTDCAWSS
ncbi:hypothetical protein BDV93DRAFT_356044 [Ceratobasidium sp. AG-I]|nr:hypothetical protein BDV93DRAFT_356044 [Ceratobasidium sp. AG-I]